MLESDRDHLTFRSVLAGLVLVVLVILAQIYTEYVINASSTNYSHFPIYAFLTFVLLALLVVPVLGRYLKRNAPSRSELFTVLIMVMVAGMIPSNGLVGFFLVVLASPFYFADPENRWADFLHDHIGGWMAPDELWAVRWLFEGLPEGQSIPWSVWLVPVLWWLLFFTALTFATLAVMVILRRQWSTNERLAYPLVQVPVALTERETEDPIPSLLRNRLFWIGAAVSFGILSWNMVSYFVPTVPEIPLKNKVFAIARDFPSIELRMNFFVLGFAYFANLDVLMSLWLFRIIYIIQLGLYNRMGVDTGGNEDQFSYGLLGWQSYGALTVLVLWGLWVARDHLKAVLSAAFSSSAKADDSEELMGYRTAVWGLALSVLFMGAWLHRAGMELKLVVAYLAGAFILFIGIGRIVAESGLLYVRGPMSAQVFGTYLFGVGPGGLSPASVTALGFTYTTISQGKGLFAAGVAQITKMGEFVRGNKRSLLWAVVGAFVVGVLAAIIFTLYFGYQYGALNFSTWHFRQGGWWVFNDTVKKMRNPFPADWTRLGYMGVGMVAMGVLYFLRLRLPWWPLHPIGLAVNCTYFTQKTFFAIFVAWVIKLVILKIGGVNLFRRSRPLFIGILVGYVVAVAISTIIDYFYFFGEGHYVHAV